MDLFNKTPSSPIKLQVKQDRIRDIKRGYPWVFSHSIIDAPQAKPGSFAVLKDRENVIFAKGMYDPSCQIAFRVCALEETLSSAAIENRICNALVLRSSIFNSSNNCGRLINGEGDGLPGLVCDKFADTAILQLDGSGPEGFWRLEAIAKLIQEKIGIRNFYYKPRSDSKIKGHLILGEMPSELVRFLEHGAIFEADLVHGQKSGFFLDQRENRQIIKSISKGKTVLNLFGYTGGFSIAAGLGGASSVVTVDIAGPAVSAAGINWNLNNLDPQFHQGLAINAFDFLEESQNKKQTFDIVIADPPSFASSKASLEKGRAAYVSLFAQCANVVSANGVLALSSCSSHVGPELFMEICFEAIAKTRRRARVIGVHGQPLDHPFPLVCRELQYLKFVLIQLN